MEYCLLTISTNEVMYIG